MRDNKLFSPEHAAILIGKQQSLNKDLLENARKGLDSIYKLNKINSEGENVELKEHKIENKKEEFNEKTKKTNEVNKKKYLVVKKPVEKSIFYQHQKQGMKYWFEDAKTKSCQFNLSQNYI